MLCHRREDELSRERAIATVVQGQNAENLLDFSEDGNEEVNGLANTLALSVNPGPSLAPTSQLDDLLGLFDTAATSSLTGATTQGGSRPADAPASKGPARPNDMEDLLF